MPLNQAQLKVKYIVPGDCAPANRIMLLFFLVYCKHRERRVNKTPEQREERLSKRREEDRWRRVKATDTATQRAGDERLARKRTAEERLTKQEQRQCRAKKHLGRGWLIRESRTENVERLELPKKHLSRERRDWLGRETRAELERTAKARAEETPEQREERLARKRDQGRARAYS